MCVPKDGYCVGQTEAARACELRVKNVIDACV